jgi:hypothetical protein
MLEALLSQRFPNRHFEIVNAAMTAINSHAILPIARECARQNGDIWVIYMGNNEVVGPFGAGTVFGPRVASLGLIRCSLALKATRTGQLLDRLLARLRPQPDSKREWRCSWGTRSGRKIPECRRFTRISSGTWTVFWMPRIAGGHM